MDHCLFDGLMEGIIGLAETARRVAPCVDGILLSPAMLPVCKDALNYKGAPMAVVRLNWSTTYCFKWNYKQAVGACVFARRGITMGGGDCPGVTDAPNGRRIQ